MKKILGLFFVLILNPLQSAEEGWQTLERLTRKNNQKSISGEILYNYRGYKSEAALLNIQLPDHIQLVGSSSKMELLRLESDRIITGQPKKNPTLAKAWELMLDIRREISSLIEPRDKAFFRDYKETKYFQIKSTYDKPFQVITLSASDKDIPFKKMAIYFDREEKLSSIKVYFSNGLYGSFSAGASQSLKEKTNTYPSAVSKSF
jgi:hypothetical protein